MKQQPGAKSVSGGNNATARSLPRTNKPAR